MLLLIHMRAIIPRSLMQTHPERIVEGQTWSLQSWRLLDSSSSSPKQQVDDDQRKNQTDATTTVVSDSWSHVVTAAAEDN